jgi:crotonobetainyl-CoA:carnitine CoA-transferase CaiB-like acyl-CoA transferase
MASPRLLEGIRIADMSTVIFGPYCTQLLADMGAEVIKVEPPKGDVNRGMGKPAKTRGMGEMHMTVNRGKRSVVWDLTKEPGKKAMRRLIETSDVFIHNVRGAAISRLGFGYEDVRKIRPDIVYVHCTGFGSSGPYGDLAAYDDVIQAASGIASLLPRVDGNPAPRYLPMAIADKVSGMTAAYATLAAIIHRLRTGEGQHVEIPMMESLVSFTLIEHLGGAVRIPPAGPTGYARQMDYKRQPFRTKDGYISIAPYTDERWLQLLEACGASDVLQDPLLSDPVLRFKNATLLNAKFHEISPQRTTQEWLDLCSQLSVGAMRVNDLEDLLEDPHLSAIGFFRPREHPTEGAYREVRPPVTFSARPNPEIAPAPHIGEHTAAVMLELGLEAPDDPR